jgi:DEAD/DEAH box helicase domain-containing protein
MNVEAILRELMNAPDYEGQIVHVERVAAREARFAKPKQPLPYALGSALRERGIERFYSHQAAALDALAAGKNVVLVSGPASGKSLCYQMPILAGLTANSAERSLLLFPTKALAQDQLRAFEQLAAGIAGLRQAAGVLDGDTPTDLRRKLRQSGRVILSNPDFLHAAILAHHSHWAAFFQNLRYVVLDELHVYAGLFGANVGNLFRRLWRVLGHYQGAIHGQDARATLPQIICCSATIANPKELAEQVVGRPMHLIADDGSARGARTCILWNPPIVREQSRYRRRSANVEAHRIAARLIANRLPTIIFSKARVTAEMIFRYVREELERMGSPLADKVTPYRGGYLPEERREIERRLFSGELLGVSTTPALELGIDVGAFEACVIVGYPGRLASFFQQAGRAGRRDRDSLIVLVAVDTLINQWIMEHPGYLFGRPIESAVVDLDNPLVVSGHLRCAAAELPVAESEEAQFGPHARPSLEVLEEKRKVKHIADRWYHASAEIPQHELSLRAFSEANVMIVDAADNDRVIGEVDVYDAPPIVHPGAIYMHLGETYEVERLDLERNMAFVRRIEADYYTQPLGGTDVDHVDRPLRQRELRTSDFGFPILDFGLKNKTHGEDGEQRSNKARVFCGEVTAYFRTFGYEKIRWYNLEAFSFHRLNLPIQSLETLAFWIESSEALVRDVYSRGLDAYAGLRGIGYAVRMVLPLFVSAETLDFSHSVGSRNTPWHTLFVYERHPRGLGFVEKAYEILEDILEVVYQRVRDCRCADGCPCCVGKPLRGETSWNIERGEGSIPSRRASLSVLEGLLGKRAIEISASDIVAQPLVGVSQSDATQKALPLNVERAIRRRLERQREAKVLHPVEPRPEVGYPMPEKPATLPAADIARRARHKIEAARRKRKQDAVRAQHAAPSTPQSEIENRESKIENSKSLPHLPEKIAASLPPESLPEVGPRNVAAQADDLRRQLLIASAARRQIRQKKEQK